MQILRPKISIVLDTRRMKKFDSYPVKMRVTFDRKQKYYSIGIDLNKEDFKVIQNQILLDNVKDSIRKRKLKEVKLKSEAYTVKAYEIISSMKTFTFESFDKQFFQTEFSRESVYSYYDLYIKQLKVEGRIGTASNYQSSLTSLKTFKPKLKFREVTFSFLKEYEYWLIKNGKSISTVGIYLRPLRAILNLAIAEGIINKDEFYPFGKRMYQIPTSKNVKKALSNDEVKKIIRFRPNTMDWMLKARDFFVFSYFANGMNIKDILLLKWKNIDGEYIRFNRAKTLNTNRHNLSPISIYITPELKSIIERWGNNSINLEEYIFPVISENDSVERKSAIIKQFTKTVNDHLKRICVKLDISKNVTTYYARHSFATHLKRHGLSTEIISESLGHSNLKTTVNYLDSFDDEVKKDIAMILSDVRSIPESENS